ncbi:MAG TPA: hypothetical protein VFP59_03540 [Candidatus Angelobacter sp.]|nr:hypothetical protein [Candidatus Angelobacter sp.]
MLCFVCWKISYFELPLGQVLEIIFTFSTLNVFCEEEDEDPMPELEEEEPALLLGLLAELLLGLLAELPLGLELLALSPAPAPFPSEPVI